MGDRGRTVLALQTCFLKGVARRSGGTEGESKDGEGGRMSRKCREVCVRREEHRGEEHRGWEHTWARPRRPPAPPGSCSWSGWAGCPSSPPGGPSSPPPGPPWPQGPQAPSCPGVSGPCRPWGGSGPSPPPSSQHPSCLLPEMSQALLPVVSWRLLTGDWCPWVRGVRVRGAGYCTVRCAVCGVVRCGVL